MGGRKRAEVPSSLSRLEQRFSAWRKTRRKGERIPIPLWKAAAQAAVDHGLNRREEKGVEYAIEYAGHVSEKYIRRYTMPSEQETESALEELFG